jgi:hypothetical protein
MKLLDELIFYCKGRGLLSDTQIAALHGIRGTYSTFDEYCPWCGRLRQPDGVCCYADNEYYEYLYSYSDESDPTEEHVGPRQAKPSRGTKRTGTELKLPALAELLRDVFEKRLTDSAETFRVLPTLYQLAGLPPLADDLADWQRFREIVRALSSCTKDDLAPKLEKSLRSKQKASLTLNQIYALISDSTETDALDQQLHGRAVTAFRSVLQLNDELPPPKFLWTLKNDVINTVFLYRRLKWTLIHLLRDFWDTKRADFEWSMKGLSPLPPDWQTMTWLNAMSLEVLLLLRSNEASRGGPLAYVPGLPKGADTSQFSLASWESAILIDANVAQLVQKHAG